MHFTHFTRLVLRDVRTTHALVAPTQLDLGMPFLWYLLSLIIVRLLHNQALLDA